MSITVDTECAHCRKPMKLEIDSTMNWRSPEADCRPIIFVPEVDFRHQEDPSIIEAF